VATVTRTFLTQVDAGVTVAIVQAPSSPGTYTLTDDNGTLSGSENITVNVVGAGTFTLRYTGFVATFDGVQYPVYVDAVVGSPTFGIEYIFSNTEITGTGPVAVGNDVPLCLTQGALIRVAEGDIPVEGLGIGDLVATPDGLRRVRFIGETRRPPIELRRQGRMPIRIEADALGELGPQAPLHCTPSHAFLIKGCLVEAQALINGTTIRQLDSWEEEEETVTYYSIELEQHALVWANGLLSETYFASVRGKHFSRTSWSNYADYQALYGEGELMQELPHPRIPFARQLPAEIRELAGVPAAVEDATAHYALT
jgi:hypothetical protein